MKLSICFEIRVDWKKRVSESSVRFPPQFEKVVWPYGGYSMNCLDAL
jgi:hypothetical protein